MKKITKLTDEQKALMPEYVERWVKIGTDTSRLDPINTEKIVKNIRNLIDMEPDVPCLIVDNPLEAWAMSYLSLKQEIAVKDLHSEMLSIFNGNPKQYDVPRCELPWMTGSFFASTFAFYDFMIEELGVELEKELWTKYKIWEASSQVGCVYPLDDCTIVSQKPKTIHLEDGKLHRDGEPALTYDGIGGLDIWSLHGVEVPEWVAKTPAQDLTLDDYSKLDNADVKAEFVRKVGIERFIGQGDIIDSFDEYDMSTHEWWHRSEYELVDMKSLFSTLDYAPYLKMVNQTTGIFHMEGVSPSCRTVGKALKERFGGKDFVINSIA
jgi:hypothetical protein